MKNKQIKAAGQKPTPTIEQELSIGEKILKIDKDLDALLNQINTFNLKKNVKNEIIKARKAMLNIYTKI